MEPVNDEYKAENPKIISGNVNIKLFLIFSFDQQRNNKWTNSNNNE